LDIKLAKGVKDEHGLVKLLNDAETIFEQIKNEFNWRPYFALNNGILTITGAIKIEDSVDPDLLKAMQAFFANKTSS
jgi:hypothetical protein